VAYGCYLTISGRFTAAACLRGAAVLAIAALVASAWYLPVELRNPGYLHYYFVERHLLGYATSTQRHGGAPWWYYLPILLGGGLPWIAYLPVVVEDGWARWSRAHDGTSGGRFRQFWRRLSMLRPWNPRYGGLPSVRRSSCPAARCAGVVSPHTPHRRADGAMVLLWCWLIGCTLFLSLSQSKLVTYIWPVFPAVAILAAVAWVRLLEGTLSKPARHLLLLTFWLSSLGAVALPPAAMLAAQSRLGARFGWPVWAVAVVVAVGAWIPLGFLAAGRFRATLCSGLLSVAAQYVVIMTMAVPPVAAAASARELAQHFNRLGRVPPRILIAEARLGSLLFYLEPELRAGLQEDQLEEVQLRDWGGLPGRWGVSADAIPTAPIPGAVVALPERRVYRALRYFDLDGVPYERAGSYRIYDASVLESRVLTAAKGSRAARR
jgi:hypothetical protein